MSLYAEYQGVEKKNIVVLGFDSWVNRDQYFKISTRLNILAEKQEIEAVVLDFCGVRYFCKDLLADLLKLRRLLAQRSGNLILCNLAPDVFYSCFRVTKLHKLFAFSSSLSETLQGL